MRWTKVRERRRARKRSGGRGSHGSRVDGTDGRGGGSGSRAAVARSERQAASLGCDPVDDPPGSHADHVAARDPDGDDAAGAAAGGVSLSAPGAGHADGAFESHADGAGADDVVVPDGAGAQSSRPAGRGAVSRGADYGHGGDRPRRAAGEALSAEVCAREGPGAVYRGRRRFRGPTRRTTCRCAWWCRPTSSRN